MGRRAGNEGSIYRRESDGKWVGAVHLGYHNGKRRRRVVYGATQRAVHEKLDRLRAENAVRKLPLAPPDNPQRLP